MTSDAPFHPAYRTSFEPRRSQTSLPSYKTEEEVSSTGDALPIYNAEDPVVIESKANDLESGPDIPETAHTAEVQNEAKPAESEPKKPSTDSTTKPKKAKALNVAVSSLVWGVASITFFFLTMFQTPASHPCPDKDESWVIRQCTQKNYIILFIWAVCVFKVFDSLLRKCIRDVTNEEGSGGGMFLSFLSPAICTALAVGTFAWMGQAYPCWENRCMQIIDNSSRGLEYGRLLDGTGLDRGSNVSCAVANGTRTP